MRNRVVNQHVLRAISIGLAAFIATSTPLTVLAEEGGSDSDETGSEQSESKSQSDHKDSASKASDSAKSSSESAKSSSESAKSSSESASSSAESAKSSSESAKSSADSAEKSSESATSKAEEAKSTVDNSDEVKSTTSEDTANSLDEASGKVDQASDQKDDADEKSDDAEKTVSDAIEAAAKATGDSTDGSDATEDSLKGKIDGFNAEAGINLGKVKDAETEGVAVTDKQFESVADKSQQAKEDVLTALETALQTDGQDRVEAAKAADVAAKLAQEAADEAEANRNAAEEDYKKKLAAYNEAAKLLGLPEYNPDKPITELPTENPNLSDQLKEIDDAYGKINEDLDAAQAAAIADLKQAKEDYEAAEATAKEAADTAELAADAAEKAQKLIDGVKNGALKESKDAVEAANEAVKKAETAIGEADKAITDAKDDKQDTIDAADKAAGYAEDAKKFAGIAADEADKTLNFYVYQARDASNEADMAYETQKSDVRAKEEAVSQAKADLEARVNEIKQQVGKEPEDWQFISHARWERKVEEALKKDKKYSELCANLNTVEKSLEASRAELAKKEADAKTKAHELEERTAAADAIKADYLDKLKLENGQKEAAEAALAALKDQYTLDDRDNYLAAEKVIMGMTNALFHEYSNNPEWMDTLYDKIKHEEEVAAAKGIATKYSSQDAAFKAAQKKMAAYLAEDFEEKIVGYGGWEGFMDPMTVGDRTKVIEAMANACSQYYLEAYNDYQAKVSALEAEGYAKAAEDAAKEAADYVKGLDGLEGSLEASKANVDAAQGILDTIKDTDGKLKAEKVYDQTADYISGVKDQVDAVADKANKIKENANDLAVESEEGAEAASAAIDSYKEQIADQQAATKKVYAALRAEGSDYDKLKKELAKLLAQLNAAQATLTKAKNAVKEAKEVAVAVETLARYTNNYASYEAEYASYKEQGGKGTIPLATGFAQITRDEEGNIIYNTANDKGFDLTNSEVISRPEINFKPISEPKELMVPETIYQAYLTEIAKEIRTPGAGVVDGIGKGISTSNMPIYWELDAEGMATGKFYSSTSELTDGGKYFVAYTFKKEGDLTTKGYHLDGYLFTYEAPEEGGNDGGGNGGGGTTGGGTTGGRRTTTTTTTVTINDAGVPLAAGLDGVVIDDGAVPLAAGIDSVMIDDEGVPLADSIPQTGDNAVPVAPVAATGITALLAAFFMGKRKKED